MNAPIETDIYSVSELNHEARQLLERQFSLVHVEGEVSNLATPASGHVYFSLKDEGAQIRCAMFRMHNRNLDFDIEDGTHVVARGRISLYEQRGDYQLIVERLEETGDGALQKKFEALKKRLGAEGLFDEKYKQAIPDLPKRIGIITSSTGAAVHDVLCVLARRFPATPIVIYPTQVQGEQAAHQIVDAINTANRRNECDVLVIARGGGSLEDLWCFNEEIVARAIFDSKIPIVSGIGHEVDITIADLVADQRAATPSAAAELVSPDINDIIGALEYYKDRLMQFLRSLYQQQNQRLDQLAKTLHRSMQQKIEFAKQKLAEISRALQTVSPLGTLERGYALVTYNEKLITSDKQVSSGEEINICLAKGSLKASVL